MKIKKPILRNLNYRLIGILCFACAVFAIRLWQSSAEPTPTAILVRIPPKPETIAQDRDLSAYDFGGEFETCGSGMPDKELKECHKAENKARDFILDHWKDKKRSYIISNGYRYSYHGRSIEHIFIEPDNNGQWRIVTRMINPYSWRISFDPNIAVSTTRSIKTKHVTKEDEYNFKPGTRYLEFLDKNGKVVEIF